MTMKICKEARNWLISQLKNAHIFEILQRDTVVRTRICKGGFKPTAQNIEKNRRLILQRLNAYFNDVPNQLLITCIRHSPQKTLFKALQQNLTPEGFRKYWRLLLQRTKQHRHLVLHIAMESQDDRLTNLGLRLMICPQIWRDDESWKKRPFYHSETLAQQLAPLMAPILANAEFAPFFIRDEQHRPTQGLLPLTPSVRDMAEGNASEETPAHAQSKSPKAAAKDNTLRKERDELRIHLKDVQKQLDEKDEQLRGLQKRLDETALTFEGALAEMKQQKDCEVQDAMVAMEAELLGIHPDIRLFVSQGGQRAANLKDRVDAALEHQKAVNGKTMLRQELKRRIKRLEEMRNKISDALDDAISPVPELAELERELTLEIENCQSKLNEHFANSSSSIPDRLHEYIKAIPYNSPEALASFTELKQTLDTPLWHGLLAPDELDAALKLIAEREKLCPIALNNQQEFIQRDGKENLMTGLTHIMTLSSIKDTLPSTMLIVDGCNVMKKDPYWAGQIQLQGLKIARNDFIQRVNRVLAGKFNSITLVFDSQGITDSYETIGKTKVIFAAKREEDQNADNYIVNHLAQMQTCDATNDLDLMVCTDDSGLEARITDLCDFILECHALTAVLI